MIKQEPDHAEPEYLTVRTEFGGLGEGILIGRLTEWKPEVSLEEGLKRTIEWLRENLSLYKPEIYNV